MSSSWRCKDCKVRVLIIGSRIPSIPCVKRNVPENFLTPWLPDYRPRGLEGRARMREPPCRFSICLGFLLRFFCPADMHLFTPLQKWGHLHEIAMNRPWVPDNFLWILFKMPWQIRNALVQCIHVYWCLMLVFTLMLWLEICGRMWVKLPVHCVQYICSRQPLVLSC